MVKGLVFCAIACCAPMLAHAGGRNGRTAPVLKVSALPDGTLTLAGQVVVRLHDGADHVPQRSAAIDSLPPDPFTMASPYAATDLHGRKEWRVTDSLVQRTTGDNGLYAVRDSLADYRKPRAFRPSAMNAMLVLRIDGKDDSPPFSVGGGGVAAVLWKAMPQ